MHNFVHEYKMVNEKDAAGKPTGYQHPEYVGSRCRHEECQENRRPATLDVVKAHNLATWDFFGDTGNTRVVVPEKRFTR